MSNGILLTSNTADYSASAAAFLPIVPDGLEYLNLFNGGAGTAARNLAPGKAASTIEGVPTYGAEYIATTGGNSIITSVSETDDITIIAVHGLTESTNAIVSNQYSPRPSNPNKGANGIMVGANNFTPSNGLIENVIAFAGAYDAATDGAATSSPGPSFNNIPIGGVMCRAVTFDEPAGVVTQKNMTSGASVTGTRTAGLSRDKNNGKLKIGAGYAGTFNGPAQVYAVAIYSRVLSADEIAKVHAWLKKYYALKGIAL